MMNNKVDNKSQINFIKTIVFVSFPTVILFLLLTRARRWRVIVVFWCVCVCVCVLPLDLHNCKVLLYSEHICRILV